MQQNNKNWKRKKQFGRKIKKPKNEYEINNNFNFSQKQLSDEQEGKAN